MAFLAALFCFKILAKTLYKGQSPRTGRAIRPPDCFEPFDWAFLPLKMELRRPFGAAGEASREDEALAAAVFWNWWDVWAAAVDGAERCSDDECVGHFEVCLKKWF